MNYNLPFEIELVLPRFLIPLYVTSTYDSLDGYLPPSSESQFDFELPWYLFFDNSATQLETSALTLEGVVYEYNEDCLEIMESRGTRNDPNCTYTISRLGPGYLEVDPYSSDYISRSVLLPSNMSSFYKEHDIRPLAVSGRKDDWTQTPIMSVCRDNVIETIYDISTGLVNTELDYLSYHYLRDEPPARTEFPDLSTFLEVEVNSTLTKCYYDCDVKELVCTYTTNHIHLDTPTQGLLIFRLSKTHNISGYSAEEDYKEDSCVIYYVFAKTLIQDIYLSDNKPVPQFFEIDNQAKWDITINNLYNETLDSAVRYDVNVLNAKTDYPAELFQNGTASVTVNRPKLIIDNEEITIIPELVVIMGPEVSEIKGQNGTQTLVFEGIEHEEELFIDATIA